MARIRHIDGRHDARGRDTLKVDGEVEDRAVYSSKGHKQADTTRAKQRVGATVPVKYVLQCKAPSPTGFR